MCQQPEAAFRKKPCLTKYRSAVIFFCEVWQPLSQKPWLSLLQMQSFVICEEAKNETRGIWGRTQRNHTCFFFLICPGICLSASVSGSITLSRRHVHLFRLRLCCCGNPNWLKNCVFFWRESLAWRTQNVCHIERKQCAASKIIIEGQN